MVERRGVYRVLVGKPNGTRPLGKPDSINPLAYTDVPEAAGLARSINP